MSGHSVPFHLYLLYRLLASLIFIMKKILSGIALTAMFALPFAASAATFSNVQFDNGDVTVSGTGGSTVNATFHIIVPANQVVENLQTDVIGDSLAPVCSSVGGDLGLQEGTHDVTVAVKLPPNTGTYTLNVQGAGIYGGIRSIDCNDNVVGTGSFSSALRTVSSDEDTSTAASSGIPAWFAHFLALFTASTTPATAPAPTVSAVCTAYAQANVGTQPNVYNSANVALQGFLLSQHISIPALAAGASFGFYGNQTTAAVGTFQSMNHCN